MYYTYVLEITDSKGSIKHYIGFSKNLKKRVEDHKSNSTKTTKNRSIKLIYYEACLDEKDARKREQSLKTGFGRSFIKNRLKSYLLAGIVHR